MKRTIMMGFAMMMILGSFVCNAQNNKKPVAAKTAAQKIEVYYFHFTRRCPTCVAVESESKKDLSILYPEQFKKGMITFKSINLDEKGNEAIAKTCQASAKVFWLLAVKKEQTLLQKDSCMPATLPTS